MDFVIRSVEPEDLEPLARLIEEIEIYYKAPEIQPFPERLEQVELALFGEKPLSYAIIAEDPAGDIVGMAAFSYLWPAAGSTHSLFLKELYVRESARRGGLATKLMQKLFQIASERPGCSRVEWMTDGPNSGARNFYKALGVAETPDRVVYRLDRDEFQALA